MNIFNEKAVTAGLIIFGGITIIIVGMQLSNNYLLIGGGIMTGFVIPFTLFIVPRLTDNKTSMEKKN